MDDPVIQVEQLSKKFRLGATPIDGLLAERLHRLVTSPFRWLKNSPSAQSNALGSSGSPASSSPLASAGEDSGNVLQQEALDEVDDAERAVASDRSGVPDPETIPGAGHRNREAADRINPLDVDDFAMQTRMIWALREINFQVSRGEVLGLIGGNGAGKSTLLKILTRITRPTLGRVGIAGRVGSLLEVGTGFHPELTGRENIYFNGAILGMRKAEIRKRFDEIVDFAGIERFLDTPVKRYSSGMHTRLAFSVAAHLEPEVLLVDEVLAVGDVKFQSAASIRWVRFPEVGGRWSL